MRRPHKHGLSVLAVSALRRVRARTWIILGVTRQREFRADRHLVSLRPAPLPDTMSVFGISGRAGGRLKRLFMTHPPHKERIAALESAVEERTR